MKLIQYAWKSFVVGSFFGLSPIFTLAWADGVEEVEERSEQQKNQHRDSRLSFAGFDFDVGAGLTTGITGTHVDEFSVLNREDGRVFVDVNKAQQTNIDLIFSISYIYSDEVTILPDEGMTALESVLHGLEAVASCGPFALVSRGERTRTRGCGPFIAAGLGANGQPSSMGLGWMVALGEEGNEQKTWGVGIGVLIDPNAKLLDERVVDRDSRLIRPEFQTDVLDGRISPVTEETSVNFLLMVSRSF